MPSKSKKATSVIIPALNEEYGIGSTLNEVSRLPDVLEIIVVDGGSVDGTAEIAEKTGAHVLIERNAGYGTAIIKGMERAEGKYVAIIAADFTYPASEIEKFIKILESNNEIGMVVGSRFSSEKLSPAISLINRLSNYLISLSFRLFYGKPATDPMSGFFAMRRKILTELNPTSVGFSLMIELRAKLLKEGLGIVEVPIDYRSRLGEKKISIRHGFSILRTILGLRF